MIITVSGRCFLSALHNQLVRLRFCVHLCHRNYFPSQIVRKAHIFTYTADTNIQPHSNRRVCVRLLNHKMSQYALPYPLLGVSSLVVLLLRCKCAAVTNRQTDRQTHICWTKCHGTDGLGAWWPVCSSELKMCDKLPSNYVVPFSNFTQLHIDPICYILESEYNCSLWWVKQRTERQDTKKTMSALLYYYCWSALNKRLRSTDAYRFSFSEVPGSQQSHANLYTHISYTCIYAEHIWTHTHTQTS